MFQQPSSHDHRRPLPKGPVEWSLVATNTVENVTSIVMCWTSETRLRLTSVGIQLWSLVRPLVGGADGLGVSRDLVVGSGSETAGPKSSLCSHLLREACGFGNNSVLGGRVHMHHDFSLGLLFRLGG